MNKFIKSLQYNPKQALSAVVILLLVLASSVGTPQVPKFLTKLLNNTVFKVIYMALILIVFKYKPAVAFALALLFLLLLQTINNYHNYIDTTKDKLTPQKLAQGLANSVSNSVNEVINDTGSIISGLTSIISESHSYLTKENFNEMAPAEHFSSGNPGIYQEYNHTQSSNLPQAYDPMTAAEVYTEIHQLPYEHAQAHPHAHPHAQANGLAMGPPAHHIQNHKPMPQQIMGHPLSHSPQEHQTGHSTVADSTQHLHPQLQHEAKKKRHLVKAVKQQKQLLVKKEKENKGILWF